MTNRTKVLVLTMSILLIAVFVSLFIQDRIRHQTTFRDAHINPTMHTDGTFDGRSDLILPIHRFAFRVRDAVEKVVAQNALSGDDLANVDFLWPGDSNYGDVPGIEVFNQEGGNAEIPEDPIDAARFANFQYTMEYGVVKAGTEKTELVAVLRGISDELCASVQANYHESRNSDVPRIDTRQAAPQLPFEKGCFQDQQGTKNYFLTLIPR